MFSLLLVYLGARLVALGPPAGSLDRGFSLSFSVFVGHGCLKHIMFLHILYRTSIFHLVFPFKLFLGVTCGFLGSSYVFLRVPWASVGSLWTLLSPLGSPVAPLLAVLEQQFYDFSIFYFS